MQKVNLYDGLAADKVGPAPLLIRALVTPSQQYMTGGVPASTTKVETYVLLSALPQELRQRVETAIATISSGI